MENLTFISLQLPLTLAVRARVIASQRNESRSEFVRKALERAIEEAEKNKSREVQHAPKTETH